uniref:Opsin n=3 Tax=Cladonema radiatum TaxID=264074 RepID=A9CR43_9CNID|nr:opsin [Cladonema radiatum]BAF95839.1 opsin [Cladonema radiatum]
MADEVGGPVILVFIVGSVFLNLLVIVGMLKKPNIALRDLILVSLAISDFIETVFGSLWEAYAKYIDSSSLFLCKMAGFGITFTALTSISHLAALAIERYLSMVHALKTYEFFADKKKAIIFIIPAWTYGTFWGGVPLLGWGGYFREPIHTFRCAVLMTSKSFLSMSYNYCLLAFCYLLPISIISICCYKVQRELKNMTERSEAIAGSSSAITESTKKAEKQHFLMICIVLVAFFIAWTPYAFTACWFAFFDNPPDELVTYSATFAKFSVVSNPIVYVIFYKDFRQTVKKMFCGRGRVAPV